MPEFFILLHTIIYVREYVCKYIHTYAVCVCIDFGTYISTKDHDCMYFSFSIQLKVKTGLDDAQLSFQHRFGV